MASDLINALSRLGLYEQLRQRLGRSLPQPSSTAGQLSVTSVPPGVAWELLNAFVAFTTSAVVATRVVFLEIRDTDNNLLARFFSARTQAASASSVNYTYAAGQGASTTNSGSVESLPTPPMVLLPGWKIQIGAASIDAGDQFTLIVMGVREWSPDQVSKQAAWLSRQLPTDILIDEGAE